MHRILVDKNNNPIAINSCLISIIIDQVSDSKRIYLLTERLGIPHQTEIHYYEGDPDFLFRAQLGKSPSGDDICFGFKTSDIDTISELNGSFTVRLKKLQPI